MYPKPSNKQKDHDKVGDAHILVVSFLSLMRGQFMRHKNIVLSKH